MHNLIIKKTLIFTFIFIFSLNICLSSEYELDYFLEMKEKVKTGDELDLGRIVFSYKLKNPQTYSINFNETYYTATLGDTICNSNNKSYNIVNERLLLQNDCFIALDSKRYEIRLLTNDSIIHYIDVTKPDYPNVKINSQNSIFKLNFEETEFVVNKDKDINISINIPYYTVAGDYNIIFNVNNETINYDLEIEQNILWNVSLNELNKSLYIGDTGNYTIGKITNDGNIFSNINLNKKGNGSDFIILPDKFISYPKNNVSFDIYYDITKAKDIGHYYVELNFKDLNDNDLLIPLNFEILDNIKPNISNTELIGKKECYRVLHYNFSVSDNSKIKSVMFDVINTDDDIVYTNFTKLDSNKAILEYNFSIPKPGDYDFVIEAKDKYGNVQKSLESHNIKKLNSFDISRQITIKKQKFDVWNKNYFGNTDFNATLYLTLKNYTYKGEVFTLRFNSNEKEYILDKIGQKIAIDEPNENITIEVQGDNVGIYEFKLGLSSIENSINYSDVIVTGEFIDYIIPEAFTTEFDDAKVSCNYVNVNDLENSETHCTFIKSGLISKENIGVPMTVEDRKKIYDNFDKVENELNDKISSRGVWIIVFMLVIVLLSIYAYYYKQLQPYLRIKKAAYKE